MEENKYINYEALLAAYDKGTVVKALVGDVSGNGHQVFVLGVPAFLPKTQEGPGKNLEAGREVDVCVIKILPENGNVVVSARVADQVLDSDEPAALEVGQVVKATVKNITQFGAFAQVGRVTGLIHITELSYNPVNSPQDVVSVGDEVTVKVINITDRDGQRRYELSLKQALPNPWDTLPFQEGDLVEGTVSRIVDYGAFLAIGEFTAMLHRSEITWGTDYPRVDSLVSVGDQLTVMVKTIDKANHKIAVSLRDISGKAWDSSELSEGDVIEVDVLKRHPSGSGLVVGREGGIEGLLPRKEMAWTKDECRAVEESINVGDTIRVVVIDFDKSKRKLVVSLRPLMENPVDVFMRDHPVGSVVEGDVVKNSNPGIIRINLPMGGFRIAFDPSFTDRWNDIIKRYPVGGKLPVLIEEYDPDTRKISFVPAIEQ